MTQLEHVTPRPAVSRRRFVQGSAIGAAGIAGGALALHPGVASAAVKPRAIPYVGAGSTAAVRPFRLTDVALGQGLLQEKRDRMKAWLRQFDERRFLVLFNNQAGRPNPPGVSVPGGWENGGLLSGHWAGHYLTALAQAHADGGEQVFKDKLDFMVEELAACQQAITERMGGGGPQEPPPEPVIVRVPGKFGQALRLNGPSDAEYLRLPQEAVSQLQNFTIATWVNLGSTQSWSRIFDFGSGSAVNMFLTARSGSGMPRFAITTSGSGGEQQVNGTTAVPVGSWVHLAVTLAGGTGTLYVNGAPAGTNPSMTLKPTDLGVPGNVWIGRSQYGDALLDAAIDEFHIYDRALTPAEITSLQGSTGSGNIAAYRFDEQGGASAEDSSPNGRDAGIVAAVEEDEAAWEPTHPGYLGALPGGRRHPPRPAALRRLRRQPRRQRVGALVHPAQDHARAHRRLRADRQPDRAQRRGEDGGLGAPRAHGGRQEPPRLRGADHPRRPQLHVGHLHRRRVRRRQRGVPRDLRAHRRREAPGHRQAASTTGSRSSAPARRTATSSS